MKRGKGLIVIAGPTGSGKTDVSIKLARKLTAPIISADSRQIFRGMAIGTAQPSAEQLSLAEHYLIANHDIAEEYTCGHYEREALALLDTLFEKHDAVIAVGGSGLYIDALCDGMDSLPEADPVLRAELAKQWSDNPVALIEKLKELDPEYFDKVDRSNPRRIIRALEVCIKSGAPYSTMRTGKSIERPFNILKIGLALPRKELYERINWRVDEMVGAGLEEEARRLYPMRELNSLQTVGYKELFDYFDGTTTKEQALDLIKRNSRRYAKRQMTWFSKDPDIKWFAPQQTEDMEKLVIEFVAGLHKKA